MLKVHDNKSVDLPGTVKAVVAGRLSTMKHHAEANVSNAEKTAEAARIMKRMHKDELN
ncbi:MAG TPA: hypothetical protein VGF75_07125 [Candidatus Saccharimonadales bacterium]